LDHQRLALTRPYDPKLPPRPWTSADQQSIVQHFSGLAAAYPKADHEAADWGSRAEQELFLDDLLSLADLQGKRIVDLGCGSGAVLRQLQSKGVSVKSYGGFEINPSAMAKAQHDFPPQIHPHVRWQNADCFVLDLESQPEAPDWVVASGLFGVRPKTWSHDEFTGLALGKLAQWGRWAKAGVLFNFIPAYDPSLQAMLDLKADTAAVTYHRMERLWVVRTLRELGFSVAGQPDNVNRMMVQCPLRFRLG